jgi:hypothetical protein
MKHPASLVVHTPKGPESCCDKHAAQLRGAMFLLGACVYTVPAAADAQCANCVNEAKKTEVA